MKKTLVKIGLVAGIATTSLLGFTYEIKQGWQQIGAIKDFDTLSAFDDPNNCVEYLWYYDLEESDDKYKWKLHISDGKNYSYTGKQFSSLNKGDGFWLKASGECNVSIEEPNNFDFMPTPPELNTTCPVEPEPISANSTVISSNLGGGNFDISKIIVNTKDSNFNTSISYTNGYFYDENSNVVIKIDVPFKLWTAKKDFLNSNGKLKITNINTNQVTTTNSYPNPVKAKEFYLMTNTLSAGTYRFEKASSEERIDGAWFFEKVQ